MRIFVASLCLCFSTEVSQAIAAANRPEHCVLPSVIDAQIEHCSHNPVAVEAAKACLLKVEKIWKEEGPKLEARLRGNKQRDFTKQKEELSLTRGDYDQTLNELEDLILFTQYNTELVASYIPALADSPQLLDDPLAFHPCYLNSKDEIQEIVYKLDDLILEGKATFEAANDLWLDASQSDEEIVDINESEMDEHYAKSRENTGAPGFRNLRHEARNSDVTGTREALLRDKSVASDAETEKLQAEHFAEMQRAGLLKPAGERVLQRQILQGFDAELTSASGPSAITQRRSPAQLPARGQGTKGVSITTSEAAQRDAASIGGLLWREPEDGSKIDLELKIGAGGEHPAGISQQSELRGDSAVFPSGRIGRGLPGPNDAMNPGGNISVETELAHDGDRAPASVPSAPKLFSAVAGSDADLFEMVRDRYRSTELFRQARIIKVPLQAFDPNFKR